MFLILGFKWEVSILQHLFDSFYFNFLTNTCLYDSNKKLMSHSPEIIKKVTSVST